MDLAGRKPDQAWLDQVVATVGLGDRLKHRPVRALRRPAAARRRRPRPGGAPGDHLRRRAHRQPRLARRRRDPRLHADAPCDDLGQTIVMVTHDPVAAAYADRVVFLADGRIVDELPEPDRRPGARPDEGARRRLMLRGHPPLASGRTSAASPSRSCRSCSACPSWPARSSLGDTFNKFFDDLFSTGGDKVDAQVQGPVTAHDPFSGQDQHGPLAESLVDEVAAVPGVRVAEPYVITIGFGTTNRVLGPDGKALGASPGSAHAPRELVARQPADRLRRRRGPRPRGRRRDRPRPRHVRGLRLRARRPGHRRDPRRQQGVHARRRRPLRHRQELRRRAVAPCSRVAEAQRIAGTPGKVNQVLAGADEG